SHLRPFWQLSCRRHLRGTQQAKPPEAGVSAVVIDHRIEVTYNASGGTWQASLPAGLGERHGRRQGDRYSLECLKSLLGDGGGEEADQTVHQIACMDGVGHEGCFAAPGPLPVR